MNKKNSIVFRELRENDITGLLELLTELDDESKRFFHPHPFDIKTLMDNCKSKDHYFVMNKNDLIIGYSFLRLFGYKTPSYGCCIRKGYENKGYGNILTELTVKKAKELGYSKIILKTYKENLSAQKIYIANGFKTIGETEDKKQYKMELKL